MIPKFRAWDKEATQMLTMPMDSYFGLERFFGFIPDNSILMQSTGLRDKKRTAEYPDGQEVFEGDVYKICCAGGTMIEQVMWDDNLAGFYRHSRKGERLPGMYRINSGIEVIGNRFENGDLLD